MGVKFPMDSHLLYFYTAISFLFAVTFAATSENQLLLLPLNLPKLFEAVIYLDVNYTHTS